MSTRDQIVLKQLNLSVSKLSKIVERPRQSVTVAINGPDDFFDVVSMRRLYDHQCSLGDVACKDVSTVIRAHFTELADAIIEQPSSGQSVTTQGESWFLCTDWVDFLDKYEDCKRDVDELIKSNETTLVIIVRHHEIDRVVRYARGTLRGSQVFVVPCVLDLPDTYILCQRDAEGYISSYSASMENGFTPTTQSKAENIRAWLARIAVEGADDTKAVNNDPDQSVAATA
ncbi:MULTISPECIES: hypothetical protein [unclassified Ruegeria]|uniref:hypothetical protein n=1 Tax=unclassified Ruegeria TaxID=2625375 RepID=UPI001488BA5D|nr:MULTISPECIES: hypothetical protein [unclassified Ruegeria]